MSFIQRASKRLEVDQAVAYAVATRGWQILAGPVTAILMTRFFPKELQGYFYTFGSVLSLQMFFELGLQTVLINLMAHEWAHLKVQDDGSIAGDEAAGSRLASLLRMTDRWYAFCAVLFAIVVGLSGFYFFRHHESDIPWQGPWLCLVAITGLSLRLVPRIALLEGCHRMREVNAARFWQALIGNLAVWTAMYAGLGLWTAVISGAVRLAWEAWLVNVRFSGLRRSILQLGGEQRLDWQQEVWPLQWRIAIQGLGFWAATSLFTPVMFHYHGSVVAGQMGMTWTLITAVQSAGGAWLSTRAPTFAGLVARREFAALDRLLFKLTLASLIFIFSSACVALLGLAVLDEFVPRLAARLLPVAPTAMFFGGILIYQLLVPQAYNIRAHRIEPFYLWGTVIYATIGLNVWYWGATVGPFGAAAAYSVLLLFLYAPLHTWIWLRVRSERQTVRDTN